MNEPQSNPAGAGTPAEAPDNPYRPSHVAGYEATEPMIYDKEASGFNLEVVDSLIKAAQTDGIEIGRDRALKEVQPHFAVAYDEGHRSGINYIGRLFDEQLEHEIEVIDQMAKALEQRIKATHPRHNQARGQLVEVDTKLTAMRERLVGMTRPF